MALCTEIQFPKVARRRKKRLKLADQLRRHFSAYARALVVLKGDSGTGFVDRGTYESLRNIFVFTDTVL